MGNKYYSIPMDRTFAHEYALSKLGIGWRTGYLDEQSIRMAHDIIDNLWRYEMGAELPMPGTYFMTWKWPNKNHPYLP